jgi:hypothetical protein
LIPVSDHPLATSIMLDSEVEQEEKLSTHQQFLKDIADKNDFRYFPGKTIAIHDFAGFSFSKGSRIDHAQNIISGVYEDVRIIYSEVIYDKTLETISPDSRISALLIRPKVDLPVFTLDKEGVFEKLTDLAIRADIDFDEFPVFSDSFVLKGPDEKKIREFFHSGLIKKIEQFPHFHIESNGNAIIVYRFDLADDHESITELFRFGKILALIV